MTIAVGMAVMLAVPAAAGAAAQTGPKPVRAEVTGNTITITYDKPLTMPVSGTGPSPYVGLPVDAGKFAVQAADIWVTGAAVWDREVRLTLNGSTSALDSLELDIAAGAVKGTDGTSSGAVEDYRALTPQGRLALLNAIDPGKTGLDIAKIIAYKRQHPTADVMGPAGIDRDDIRYLLSAVEPPVADTSRLSNLLAEANFALIASGSNDPEQEREALATAIAAAGAAADAAKTQRDVEEAIGALNDALHVFQERRYLRTPVSVSAAAGTSIADGVFSQADRDLLISGDDPQQNPKYKVVLRKNIAAKQRYQEGNVVMVMTGPSIPAMYTLTASDIASLNEAGGPSTVDILVDVSDSFQWDGLMNGTFVTWATVAEAADLASVSMPIQAAAPLTIDLAVSDWAASIENLGIDGPLFQFNVAFSRAIGPGTLMLDASQLIESVSFIHNDGTITDGTSSAYVYWNSDRLLTIRDDQGWPFGDVAGIEVAFRNGAVADTAGNPLPDGMKAVYHRELYAEMVSVNRDGRIYSFDLGFSQPVTASTVERGDAVVSAVTLHYMDDGSEVDVPFAGAVSANWDDSRQLLNLYLENGIEDTGNLIGITVVFAPGSVVSAYGSALGDGGQWFQLAEPMDKLAWYFFHYAPGLWNDYVGAADFEESGMAYVNGSNLSAVLAAVERELPEMNPYDLENDLRATAASAIIWYNTGVYRDNPGIWEESETAGLFMDAGLEIIREDGDDDNYWPFIQALDYAYSAELPFTSGELDGIYSGMYDSLAEINGYLAGTAASAAPDALRKAGIAGIDDEAAFLAYLKEELQLTDVTLAQLQAQADQYPPLV